jgi:hypothetical protein
MVNSTTNAPSINITIETMDSTHFATLPFAVISPIIPEIRHTRLDIRIHRSINPLFHMMAQILEAYPWEYSPQNAKARLKNINRI